MYYKISTNPSYLCDHIPNNNIINNWDDLIKSAPSLNDFITNLSEFVRPIWDIFIQYVTNFELNYLRKLELFFLFYETMIQSQF